MKILTAIAYTVVSAAVIAAAVRVGMRGWETGPDTSLSDRTIGCAIELSGSSVHLPGLTVGYNYELLHRFARANRDTLSGITLSEDGASYLDSLLLGVVDIVVLPYTDSLQRDSVVFSHSIDSLTVWAVREERADGLKEVNAWIDSLMNDEGHEPLRDLFLLRYSPAKRAEWGRTLKEVSPYDDIIKAYAKEIGWDWRLLAAVIYQESKFHIEARSPRGARGLMQMMPRTAERFGVTDLVDPEESLKAGAGFLSRLRHMFEGQAIDEDELIKFTLAAFNAGEGRITDCINYANSIGADSGTWDGIVSVIPEMRDESTFQVDSVIQHGTFQGIETIAYVDQVLSLYEDFKVICPR